MRRFFFISTVFIAAACSAPEFTLGAAEGIPAVSGSTEVTLDGFTCGDPIPAGDFTVTTKVASSAGCELSFDKDVVILKTSDYGKLPAFQGGASLLQSIDVLVKKLAFTDTSTSPATQVDPATRITSVKLSISGQLVADKSTLSRFPMTVSLTGAALSAVKAKVDLRQPAIVHVTAVMVIPDTPAPPKKLKVDYDSQPSLVLGTGSINLGQ